MNRRFVRSRTDRVFSGVAAGLADYMNADTALVRIAWALLVPLTGGAAFIAYIVAWIVVPEAPDTPIESTAVGAEGGALSTDPDGTAPLAASGPSYAPPATTTASGDGNRAGLVVGIGLVLIGLWFLLREYLPDFDWTLVWPIVLIGIGVLILISVSRRRTDG